jgi:maleylpyruvate isomerase
MTDARRWMAEGTKLLRETADRIDDTALSASTALPGWSRRHLLAHVSANADALRRLAHWARTGEERRMYDSPDQRAAEIEHGSRLPAGELRSWLRASAEALAEDLTALTPASWQRTVVTAQGRAVPATEIPWLRSREVMIHAVDLDAGVGFADLPRDFLHRLVADVVARRSGGAGPSLALTDVHTGQLWHVAGTGEPVEVAAPLTELAAWLTGRPGSPAGALPDLPPWL